MNKKLQKATLAAGCFWGIEDMLRMLKGVKETLVGYTGGNKQDPSYEEVCSKSTGHAEAVQLEFDPEEISYEEILNKFWAIHNPTTPNRDGPNIGSQYRSAIFYHSPEQKDVAESSMAEHAANFSDPIVTEIIEASTFYPAEEYHQKFYMKRGGGSCQI